MRFRWFIWLLCLFHGTCGAEPHNLYRWHDGSVECSVEKVFQPPAGFRRPPAEEGGFDAWLRGLPLRCGHPPVHLFDGRLKANQEAHVAVLDVDVGDKDLQQCADAVIRLRAEYLYACGHEDAISFRFTSGDPAAWQDWAAGMRPVVQKNLVSWRRTARPDSTYANFRQYLNSVFAYAGSASLAKQLKPVSDPAAVQIGNVFIHGGFPGHAVLVVDVAIGPENQRLFLLAQSYMPAQEIHILHNPGSRYDPWYPARSRGDLATPEWTFRYEELRRFAEVPPARQSQH